MFRFPACGKIFSPEACAIVVKLVYSRRSGHTGTTVVGREKRSPSRKWRD